MTWRAHVHNMPWQQQAALHIWRVLPGGLVDNVEPLVLKSHDPGTLVREDHGAMNAPIEEVDEFLRAVMTVGWERGIRPEGFEDHTNELKAVRYHLEDMRKLAEVT